MGRTYQRMQFLRLDAIMGNVLQAKEKEQAIPNSSRSSFITVLDDNVNSQGLLIYVTVLENN